MVNISSFVRDMGIGALAQVETNRAATAKRAEDRATQEAERRKRLGEIQLQAELSAAQNRETIEGRATQADLDRTSREKIAAIAKATAITKDAESKYDWGFGLLGFTVPNHKKFNYDTVKNITAEGSARIESKVVQFDTASQFMWEGRTVQQQDILKDHMKKELKTMVAEGRLYAPSFKAIGGDKIGGNFHFQTGAPFLYNLFKDDKDMKKLIDGPSGDMNAPDPIVDDWLNTNQNSPFSQYMLNQNNLFKRARFLNFNQHAVDMEHVSGIIPVFLENRETRQLVIDKIKKGGVDPSLVYNPKNPFRHLVMIAELSTAAHGSGTGKTTALTGQRININNKSSSQEARLKLYRDRYGEARTIINDLVKLHELGDTLNETGVQELGVLFKLQEVSTTLVRSLNPFSTSKDKKTQLDKIDVDTVLLGTDGEIVEGLNAKTYFTELQKASNNRLVKFHSSIAKDGTLTAPQRTEQYAAMVQWEARTIQLVYKIAKMVQGGSGGQAVSNADFQAVLKSFQMGALGSREGTVHVLKMLQRMVEREYVHHKVLSNPNIIKGSQRAADNAVRFFDLYHPRPLIGGGTEQTSGTTQTGSTQLHSDGFPFEGTDAWYALNASVRVRILEKRNAPS